MATDRVFEPTCKMLFRVLSNNDFFVLAAQVFIRLCCWLVCLWMFINHILEHLNLRADEI